MKGIDIFQSKVNIKIVFSEKIKITEDFSFNIKTDDGLKIEIKNSSNKIFLSQKASVEVIDSGWLKRYRAGQMMR